MKLKGCQSDGVGKGEGKTMVSRGQSPKKRKFLV